MLSDSVADGEETVKDIHLHDEVRLQNMLQWYDQQIGLAAKSKELAELKAAIAKARAEEMYALLQIARMTVDESGEKAQDGNDIKDE